MSVDSNSAKKLRGFSFFTYLLQRELCARGAAVHEPLSTTIDAVERYLANDVVSNVEKQLAVPCGELFLAMTELEESDPPQREFAIHLVHMYVAYCDFWRIVPSKTPTQWFNKWRVTSGDKAELVVYHEERNGLYVGYVVRDCCVLCRGDPFTSEELASDSVAQCFCKRVFCAWHDK